MSNLGLTNKDIVQLRLKCLEPYIITASKANIEQDTIIKKAEVAWNYAIKPLLDTGNQKTPDESQPSSQKPSS